MKKIDVTLKGIAPLLMHSPRGVDPTDPLQKKMREITSKGSKKKTAADLLEQDWLEFQLAIYYENGRPVIPDSAILGTLQAGARANRRGREVQAGVEVADEFAPLDYAGPRGLRELYDARFVDRRPAGVQKARVMRVRPRFNEWAVSFRLLVDDEVMNVADVKTALDTAGLRCGLLDYRPRFGRFEVTGWKEVV